MFASYGRLVRYGGMVFLCAALASAPAAADDLSKLSQEVQGRWVRTQNTPQGVVTLIKEHEGVTTRLTAMDAAKTVLYAHTSEFTVEQSGKVRIWTFFNRQITAGPGAGQTVKEPTSFVYRVHNDRFVEVYGVLPDDPSPPRMIVWERQK